MFNNNYRVPLISDFSQQGNQTAVISLVKTYGRLIQDIEYAPQASANLRSQT